MRFKRRQLNAEDGILRTTGPHHEYSFAMVPIAA